MKKLHSLRLLPLVSVFSLLSCGVSPSSSMESFFSSPESEVSSSASSEEISSSSSSSESSITLEPYYSGLSNLGALGTSFRDSLQKYINAKSSKTIDYNSLDSILKQSDADPSSKGKTIGFYTEKSLSTFNKEHVWPDSRGVGKSGPGSDPQMIRPTDPSDNGARGNMVFGTVANTYDPASLGYPYYRGISARIIFYTCMRYWNAPSRNNTHLHLTDLAQPNSTSASNTGNQMGRISELLKWNRDYPIDEKETRRNNVLEGLGYARNPFIDHPEWVDKIWDVETVTTNIDTCYYRVA